MRPIELTMQAFGPYVSETVIPFDRIADGGLYLICGDTGSGKTMLFDAITYALYGNASGSNRDSSMLRSKFASPDTKTYVKLTFENHGKEYTVYREWGREKLKKGVLTEEKSNEAWLLYPNGSTVAKHKDVTAAVTEILGLDCERFAKTVMIAQGEFRELLYADTKDRMVILRRIFGTELFEKFALNAKAAAKKVLTDAENLRAEAGKYASLISSDDEVLRDLLHAVPAVSTDHLREAAKGAEEKSAERIEHVSREYLSADKSAKEARYRLSRAEIDRKREKEAELCRLALEKAEKRCEIAAKGAEETKDLPEKAAELNEQVSLYKNELPAYAELDSLLSAVRTEEAALAEITAKADKARRRITAAEAEIDRIKKFLEESADVPEQSRILSADLEKLKNEEKRLASVTKKFAELRSAEKLSETRKSAYEHALKALAEARRRHTDAMKQYFDGIAGVLSSALTDGEPCPVCGSTSHPSPAPHDSTSVTRELLDSLSRESEKCAKSAEECASSLAQVKGTMEQLASALTAECEEMGFSSEFGKIESEVSERIREINGETAHKTALLTEYSRILAEIAESREKLDRYTELLDNERKNERTLTESAAEKNAVIGEKKSHADALSKKLTFPTAAALRQEIAKLTEAAADMTAREERARKLLITTEKELEAAKRALETVASQLEDSIAEEYEACEALCRELDEKTRLLTQEKLRLMTDAEKNRSAMALLLTSMEKLSQTEADSVLYGLISDTANGNVNGKDKIMLETFWQMRLFERILRRANIRLMKMTDGRYELIRRKTAANQKSQSGLDLDILDHWNGTTRSVKSLSGGEAFTASLSLALALSDETESESGGVRIDAMFIDEGFGSLDEESLAQAMSVLEAQSEAGKSVGIISHVEALRERIPRKITVRKQNGTSRVEFEGI